LNSKGICRFEFFRGTTRMKFNGFSNLNLPAPAALFFGQKKDPPVVLILRVIHYDLGFGSKQFGKVCRIVL